MLYRLVASREAKIVKHSLEFICKIARANPWLTYALPCTKELTFNPEQALGCYPTTELQTPLTSGVNPPETATCLLKSVIRQWSLLHCISMLFSCHQMPLDYVTWHGIGSPVNHRSFIWHPTLVTQKSSSCSSMRKNTNMGIRTPLFYKRRPVPYPDSPSPLHTYSLNTPGPTEVHPGSWRTYKSRENPRPPRSTELHSADLSHGLGSGYICRSKRGKIPVRSILYFSKECIASKEIK